MKNSEVGKNRGNGEDCLLPNGITCDFERQVKTNGDRIRSMTDEELAWELMTWRIETCARLNGAESPYPYTQKGIMTWLQQPAEEGLNDEHSLCKYASTDR